MLAPMSQPSFKTKATDLPARRSLAKVNHLQENINRVTENAIGRAEGVYSRANHSTSPVKMQHGGSRNERVIKKSQSKSVVARANIGGKKKQVDSVAASKQYKPKAVANKFVTRPIFNQ